MKVLARISFFLYLALFAGALAITLTDPVWGRPSTPYQGMGAVIVSVIVALPWSILFLLFEGALHFTRSFENPDVAAVIVLWMLAGLNVSMLARWAFWRTKKSTDPESARDCEE